MLCYLVFWCVCVCVEYLYYYYILFYVLLPGVFMCMCVCFDLYIILRDFTSCVCVCVCVFAGVEYQVDCRVIGIEMGVEQVPIAFQFKAEASNELFFIVRTVVRMVVRPFNHSPSSC